MIYIHSEKIHNTLAPNLILPIVFDIIKPTSVLDVGCGIGTWLSVCKDLGVVDVLGVDGDHVNRNLIKKYILDYEFMPYDLNLSFDLSRKYDLAICLEVLEHLPESSAVNIVNSLVAHSDVILFSAAIPGQGGQNHLNEQWPSYWIDLFSRHDFVFIDKVRPLIWNNKTIEFWYRQNIFLVVNKNHPLAEDQISNLMFGVHPDLFVEISNSANEMKSKIDYLKNEIHLINTGSRNFKFYIKVLLKKFLKWMIFPL